MADNKTPAITSKWEAVCDAGQDIELPLGGQINGFKGYHYDEMIKRLNNVDKGKIGSVGYLLRKLWKRHESGFVMHETNVYSSQHEQSQKANKDEFEKRYKKKEIGFRKNESGVWGVYSDLLYDTYQKDWSKAYQLTFHYFFRNMDYLSNYMDNEFFSYVHSDVRFFAFGKKSQFGEVIIKESDNLIGSKAKLDEIHGLPNHSKAPLYDIIYVVLGSKGRSDRDREQFRHGYGYWLGSVGAAADLPKILSMEVFGHMASAAVVNPKTLETMKKYLPNSYEMFIDILQIMVLRLENAAISRYYGKPTDVGELFYKFLSDNFPYSKNGEREKFNRFMKGIYGKDACVNLDWLHHAIISNNIPRPNLIRIDVMKDNVLGAYKDNVIYINQRLATNSLHNQETCFILLLVLLHEYGHFLDGILRERAGLRGSNSEEGEKGKAFTEKFMKSSAADLFNKPSFEFADLKVSDAEGRKQEFMAKISDLDYERRMGIFCFFEYSEYATNGDLELLGGETVNDVEFFKLAVHIELTKEGAKAASIPFNFSLWHGCIWPDVPFLINSSNFSHAPPNIDVFNIIIAPFALAIKSYNSHLGGNQHWHSMCPKSDEGLKNYIVKKTIIDQAEEWYSEAIRKRDEYGGYFALGKLCHMVQDSYCLAHCWRRYVGDQNIEQVLLSGIKGINIGDDDKIWTFQDFRVQSSHNHGYADERYADVPKKEITIIGYESAKEATKKIMQLYKNESKFDILKSYLNEKVYVIHPDREDEQSGDTHPLFSKENELDDSEVKKGLIYLSNKYFGK